MVAISGQSIGLVTTAFVDAFADALASDFGLYLAWSQPHLRLVSSAVCQPSSADFKPHPPRPHFPSLRDSIHTLNGPFPLVTPSLCPIATAGQNAVSVFAVPSRTTPSTNPIVIRTHRVSTRQRCAQEQHGSVRSSQITRFAYQLLSQTHFLNTNPFSNVQFDFVDTREFTDNSVGMRFK